MLSTPNRNVPLAGPIEMSPCLSRVSRVRGCGNVGIAQRFPRTVGRVENPARTFVRSRCGERVFHAFQPAVISTARPAVAPIFPPPVFPQPDSASTGAPRAVCGLPGAEQPHGLRFRAATAARSHTPNCWPANSTRNRRRGLLTVTCAPAPVLIPSRLQLQERFSKRTTQSFETTRSASKKHPLQLQTFGRRR
jgi:hypothetical protein